LISDPEYSHNLLNRIKRVNLKKYYTSADIANYYDCKTDNLRQIYKRYKKDFFENEESETLEGERLTKYKEENNLKTRAAKLAVYTVDGFVRFGLMLQSNAISNQLKLYIIETNIPKKFLTFIDNSHLKLQEENKFYKILTETFKGVGIVKTQVKCGSYRIDFVIDNIAIECDEYGHKAYDNKKEEIREDYIVNQGYRLVRYNPHKESPYTAINKILSIKLSEENALFKL